jgi:flagellar hook assembly protein FlgD
MWRAKNPPDAIVAYYLKSAADAAVRIQIVDADGKVVRDLDGPRGAGIHRVAWDLKSAGGARVTAGSYAVRLTANGRTSTASLEVSADPNRR